MEIAKVQYLIILSTFPCPDQGNSTAQAIPITPCLGPVTPRGATPMATTVVMMLVAGTADHLV